MNIINTFKVNEYTLSIDYLSNEYELIPKDNKNNIIDTYFDLDEVKIYIDKIINEYYYIVVEKENM